MTIKTEERRPYIVLGGKTIPVTVKSVDAGTGIIVLRLKTNNKILAFRKHYSGEDHSSFTLDAYLDDKYMANYGYVRPN